MKFVLVLAVLLHLSYSTDTNLTEELINGLEKLNRTHAKFPPKMQVPSEDMQKNSVSCMGVFTRSLDDLLNKTTAKTDEGRILLHQLQRNIKSLPPSPAQNNSTCTMTPARSKKNPLMPYATFLQMRNRNPQM